MSSRYCVAIFAFSHSNIYWRNILWANKWTTISSSSSSWRSTFFFLKTAKIPARCALSLSLSFTTTTLSFGALAVVFVNYCRKTDETTTSEPESGVLSLMTRKCLCFIECFFRVFPSAGSLIPKTKKWARKLRVRAQIQWQRRGEG